MYSLTLEINQKCNLKCKYCYLQEKNGEEMSEEVLCSAIDFGVQNATNHNDKKLDIDFIGGEPLINFELIKKAVAYAKLKALNHNIEVSFMITTNGLLLNKEIVDFLISESFNLKISIDGNKKVNDTNRIYQSGKGSYEGVIKQLAFVKDFEKRARRLVRVTNVVTKNNYKHYFDSVYHLVENLNLHYIDSCIDLFPNWTQDELETIQKEICKIFDFFIEKYIKGEGFYWRFINHAEELMYDKQRFYSCGAGIVASYIRVDGEIFPCGSNTTKEVSLGNVRRKVNYGKIRFLMNLDKIDNEKCKICYMNEKCRINSCIMENLNKNGTINKPVDTLCIMEKFAEKLYQEKKEILLEVFGK